RIWNTYLHSCIVHVCPVHHSAHLLVFMIPRPPRAPLFPYTTLFRSKLSLRRKRSSPNVFEMAATETITSIILIKLIMVSVAAIRSEERFSRNAETDLVCRLLLEKKNYEKLRQTNVVYTRARKYTEET